MAQTPENKGLLGPIQTVNAYLQLVYLSTRGQTLGKMIVGVRIVRTDGSNPGFVHAVLLRLVLTNVITAIPIIGWLFGLIDILMIFGSDRRCLHDQMADTVVVQV